MLISLFFGSAYKELVSLPKEDENRKSVIVPIDQGNADPSASPIAAVFTTEIIYLALKQEEENNTFVGVTTPHDLVRIVTKKSF